VALFLPPALSLKSFNGGYNSKLDTFLLGDNMTNDARNVEIGSTIKKRNGYVRMLNTALTKTGLKVTTGLSADRIQGHYQFVKQAVEDEISKHVVAAGSNLWDYNSGTANIVLSGLKDDPSIQWNFAQIMSPTDGADDVVIGTNGEDMPTIWNGTDASAAYLNSIAGTSGVSPAKFIVSTKGRIALLHIKDDSDVDAGSKFMLSGFDTAGTPTPHVFPADLMAYAGGNDRYGPITGAATLNGDIVIFKRNTIYMFTIGGGTTIDTETLSLLHDFSLKQVDENIGCVAPKTICSIGNAIVFMSDIGVYVFDGVNTLYLSEAIENDLKNINISRKELACGAYNRAKNQYWLSIANSSQDFNDTVFVYDFNLKIWFAPYDNMRCDVMSNYRDGNEEKLICGDKFGYLYEMDKGSADGTDIGYSFVCRTGAKSTSWAGLEKIFIDSPYTLPYTGDGCLGMSIYSTELGDNRQRIIVDICADHTAIYVSHLYSAGAAETNGATFKIANINSYFRTKDFDIGSPDLDKMFRSVNVRAKQFGDFNFNVNYILDFNEITNAGTATVSQYDNKYFVYDMTSQTSMYIHEIQDYSASDNKIYVSGNGYYPTSGSGLQGHYVSIRATQWSEGEFVANNTADSIELASSAKVSYKAGDTYILYDSNSLEAFCGTFDGYARDTSSVTFSAGTNFGTACMDGHWVFELYHTDQTSWKKILSNTSNTITVDETALINNLYYAYSFDIVSASIDTRWTASGLTINLCASNAWDNSLWGPGNTKINNISLRSMDTQPLVGKFFALKFYNENPGEPWEIFGIDIVAKTIGRR